MAGWEVKAYQFIYVSAGHSISVTTIDKMISGKLTMTLGDTSKLVIEVPTASTWGNMEPVKTLLEVKYGSDRKFFGTVVKATKDVVNGTVKYDAVGVLGSFQFLPNWQGYDSNSTVLGMISVENQRFRGTYSSGDAHYTDSPWNKVYTPLGEGNIPSQFGYLRMDNYALKPTCDIEKVMRRAKNSYDFLKTITKENNYALPTTLTNPTWFRWIEYGEWAYFKPISGYNSQVIRYDANLISCSTATSPYKTRVHCYWNGNGSQVSADISGQDYPNPFYYRRYELPNKDDGSAYINAEAENASYNYLAEREVLTEAVCFDRHLADNSIEWLDMAKKVRLIYWDGSAEQSLEAQISEIAYDLSDSTKDRVKLGRIVSTITDSVGGTMNDIEKAVKEYLPLAGGQMHGDITYDETSGETRKQYEISKDGFSTNVTSSYGSTSIESITSASGQNIQAIYKVVSNGTQTELYQTTQSAGNMITEENVNGNTKKAILDPNGLFIFDGSNVQRFQAYKSHLKIYDRLVASCNLLDKELIEQGGINASTDGSEFASSQRIRTRFIPISPDTTYTVSVSGAVKTGGVCYYNASKARVSGVSMTSGKVSSFTSPSGASYVRLVFVNENSTSSNVSPSDVTGAQLEKGSLGSAIVPYTMDGTEIADKLRTLEYNASDRVTQSTSLSDTGVSVTLGKKGWYIIHLEGVANNSGVQKLAMFVNYSGTNLAQLAFSEASGVSGIARMYCTFAGYIEWNNAVVKAYASYSGATQNVINITAKRLYD